MSNTAFADWRRKARLTQTEAAAALGVGIRTVKEYEAGKDSKTGKERKPPLSVRKVMGAIVKGIYLEPWPE